MTTGEHRAATRSTRRDATRTGNGNPNRASSWACSSKYTCPYVLLVGLETATVNVLPSSTSRAYPNPVAWFSPSLNCVNVGTLPEIGRLATITCASSGIPTNTYTEPESSTTAKGAGSCQTKPVHQHNKQKRTPQAGLLFSARVSVGSKRCCACQTKPRRTELHTHARTK